MWTVPNRRIHEYTYVTRLLSNSCDCQKRKISSQSYLQLLWLIDSQCEYINHTHRICLVGKTRNSLLKSLINRFQAEMGAIPVILITAFWGFVGIALPILAPKGPNRGLVTLITQFSWENCQQLPASFQWFDSFWWNILFDFSIVQCVLMLTAATCWLL